MKNPLRLLHLRGNDKKKKTTESSAGNAELALKGQHQGSADYSRAAVNGYRSSKDQLSNMGRKNIVKKILRQNKRKGGGSGQTDQPATTTQELSARKNQSHPPAPRASATELSEAATAATTSDEPASAGAASSALSPSNGIENGGTTDALPNAANTPVEVKDGFEVSRIVDDDDREVGGENNGQHINSTTPTPQTSNVADNNRPSTPVSILKPPCKPGSASIAFTKNVDAVDSKGSRKAGQHATDEAMAKAYAAVPVLELTTLPRGGISMETQGVGRVQFGIPPETIKDSMRLGLDVPSVYIVPVERFCREMGPALGVNLAEFEFPAYFNFFVQRKRCTLIVDSDDAERNIRRVFSETLLGPAQFRRGDEEGLSYMEEDFDPDFPREAIPDFQKELKHFRIMPNGEELVLETLLKFCHFEIPGDGSKQNLGVPPALAKGLSDKSISSSSKVPAQNGQGDNAQDADEYDDAGDDESEMAACTNVEDIKDLEGNDTKTWTYSQAKLVGDVATVFPSDATPDEIAARTTKRVEIFKMPGGTEYILHDIDENNIIVGKARFSGHVRVSESMSVDGFGGRSFMDVAKEDEENKETEEGADSDGEEEKAQPKTVVPKSVLPPTFHPPSFGVTVLGNSHGFDKSGSVSGYVLWINGRGVMIDPPPYSSATLEREGIRPRTIVGIILTHCHADHDAGAFQKVLTGSPVVVITTPTIYSSFIRKYAALSALSPALLRHSHRHKPAIIGAPLRFQGATFHFTYTLHTIPCVGFRVDWRGRSMVFTGDHMNIPSQINDLQEKGVLSAARADDLRNLPLQDTDLLLHEAGAPPIHTPLDELLKLPQRVKEHLYVVHTSALPPGCELRVAPTGTTGTIRLDQLNAKADSGSRANLIKNRGSGQIAKRTSIYEGLPFEEDGVFSSLWDSCEYDTIDTIEEGNEGEVKQLSSSMVPSRKTQQPGRLSSIKGPEPPLVSLRPTSSSDAWFTLNLLSAVPFLSSLSYSSTMEVLETARVDAFCINDVVVPSSRRKDLLCVVWEGTCMEREKPSSSSSNSQVELGKKERPKNDRRISTFELNHGKHKPLTIKDANNKKRIGAVWHAGDWTGPRSLQPEKRLSGESSLSETHDIVAMSSEGVKVISIEFSNLHAILKNGSSLYRKYLIRRAQQHAASESQPLNEDAATKPDLLLESALRNLNVIELLDSNSALRKLSAVQKRHLESLAEGPKLYGPGQRLWRSGAAVDKAFLVVSGTVSFVPRRRNAGSIGMPKRAPYQKTDGGKSTYMHEDDKRGSLSLGETMLLDAERAVRELGHTIKQEDNHSENSSISSNHSDDHLIEETADRTGTQAGEGAVHGSMTESHDYIKLTRGLQKRADHVNSSNSIQQTKRDSSSTEVSLEPSLHDFCESVQSSVDHHYHDDGEDHELGFSEKAKSSQAADICISPSVSEQLEGDKKEKVTALIRRRSSRDRFANKVLGRLYSRRAFTSGLVFSRGHFLGDVSKMVAGLLSDAYETDDNSAKYGFGEKSEGTDNANSGTHIGEMVIHEQEGDQHVVHNSTLAAGKDGCVVLFFPKTSLIPFLDEYPGLLLSLLGTQVVV